MVLKMLYLICTCKIQITKFKKYKSWNPKDWWLVWASLWLAVEVLREPIWGQLPGNNYWARLRGVSEFVLLKIFHLYHTRSLIHSYRRSCQDLPSLKRICMAFSRTRDAWCSDSKFFTAIIITQTKIDIPLNVYWKCYQNTPHNQPKYLGYVENNPLVDL